MADSYLESPRPPELSRPIGGGDIPPPTVKSPNGEMHYNPAYIRWLEARLSEAERERDELAEALELARSGSYGNLSAE